MANCEWTGGWVTDDKIDIRNEYSQFVFASSRRWIGILCSKINHLSCNCLGVKCQVWPIQAHTHMQTYITPADLSLWSLTHDNVPHTWYHFYDRADMIRSRKTSCNKKLDLFNRKPVPACNAELSGSPFFVDVLLLLLLLLRWSVVGLTLALCIQIESSLILSSASTAPRYKLKIFVSQRTEILRLSALSMWWSIRVIMSDQASFAFDFESLSFGGRIFFSIAWIGRKPTLLDWNTKQENQTKKIEAKEKNIHTHTTCLPFFFVSLYIHNVTMCTFYQYHTDFRSFFVLKNQYYWLLRTDFQNFFAKWHGNILIFFIHFFL